MKVIYAHEEGEDVCLGIFLAGPSPRENYHLNWRPEALKLLEAYGFEGPVYVPLPRDGVWTDNYEGQIDWEVEYLNRSRVIVFWIPRSFELPGYTTNVEFGEFMSGGNIILGYPKEATKMNYLAYRAKKLGIPIYHSLEATLAVAEVVHRRKGY